MFSHFKMQQNSIVMQQLVKSMGGQIVEIKT